MHIDSRRFSLSLALALISAAAAGCYGLSRPLGVDGSPDDGGPGDDGSPGRTPDSRPWVEPDAAPDSWITPEVDAGPDGLDSGPVDCPGDMVQVPGMPVCIDRYEASRGDDDVPRSVAGQLPWAYVTWSEAAAACELAGKRLCSAGEWLRACGGEEGHAFPYGDFFHAGQCNDESTASGSAAPAGSFDGCEGGVSGLFDMSGNVQEWLLTPSLAERDAGLWYAPVGGSFQEAEGCVFSTSSGYNPDTVRNASTGFRCCLEP